MNGLSHWRVHWVAALALSAGCAIYLYARPDSVFFLGSPVALPLAGQLPSFLHTLAFALACALVAGNRETARIVMLGWGMLEVLAETAQHDLFPVPSLLQRYQLASTFDAGDLLAIVAAIAVAFVLTRATTDNKVKQ